MYTDGVTEARAGGDLLGERRLAEAVAGLPEDSDPPAALAAVQKLVSDFQEDHLTRDDIAMLALSVDATQSPVAANGTGAQAEGNGRMVWTANADADERAPLALLFPADPGQLARVRAATRRWLDAAGVGSNQAAEIVLAMNEAISNAVAHAYADAEEPRSISVDAHTDGNELTLVVTDRGVWRRRRKRSEGGRGLGLIETLADDHQLGRTPGGGTEVRLRWQLAS